MYYAMQGDTFNSVATEEDMNIYFKFNFQAVVEHRKSLGETQSTDISGDMVSKMTRL
jgi:hypothetical protein